MDNPLHHFELHLLIPIHLFGLDLSVNQAVVMMWVVAAAVFAFFWTASRAPQLVPSRIQSLAEISVEFLRGLILENMGERGLRFFPFLVTLFFFILFGNLLGLVPGTYTITSQLMVTGVFSLIIYVVSVIVGFNLHGLHFLRILVPPGTPGWLLPLMLPIEIISQLARPMTLALRLFANMTAGHTVLYVLFGLMLAGGAAIGWLPFSFTVAVYILEVLVAFIQAFIFTILATVYLGDAIKLH